MQNETDALRNALSASTNLITALHGTLTNEIIQSRAAREAMTEIDPKFAEVYQKFLTDAESGNIRNTRSFQIGQLVQALQSIKR